MEKIPAVLERNQRKHSLRFGDLVALVEILDERYDKEVYRGTFKIKNYSYLGFNYKKEDKKFQNEIGYIIKANNPNPNEVTVYFGEDSFVTVPWFCCLLVEKTSRQLTRDQELLQVLLKAKELYGRTSS